MYEKKYIWSKIFLELIFHFHNSLLTILTLPLIAISIPALTKKSYNLRCLGSKISF